MKLAVTGKGGVGKTTTTALLAKRFAAARRPVLAVDADPNATLAACLGFPDPDGIAPLNEMDDLIEERTGVRPGTQGAFYKLNPRVDDIPERFAVSHEGIRLLRMGAVKQGGGGCYCPENAFLKSLVSHLVLSERDVLLMDMEAGVEHFGRATAASVDWLLIVVEASRQSVETARRIRVLAGDIGIEWIGLVGNKIRDEGEAGFIAEALSGVPVLGSIPYDEGLRLSEREGRPPEPGSSGVAEAVEEIVDKLAEKGAGRSGQ